MSVQSVNSAEVDTPSGQKEQSPSIDSGLLSFCMLLHFLKVPVDPDAIRNEFAPAGTAFDSLTILRAAKSLDLKARSSVVKPKRLDRAALPAIARGRNGEFFILARVQGQDVLIQRPGHPPQTLTVEQLWSEWAGDIVYLTKRSVLAGEERKFDITWFIPVIVKYRKLFGDVLLASFFLQLFALVTPLFFQVVIDKVLVHRGLTTLDVLVVGLVAITLFEIVLGTLRTYIFSHTASRVDVELGARLFRHLLNLPIAYFGSRAVGQIVARVRELESIRSFLTGNALTVVLDLVFTVVFFAVMFYFSPLLTFIVLGSIPFYVILSIAITPELRRRTEEKFQRGAQNQSFLVESVSGIETLKAMAVEPQMRQQWEEQLAGYVKASFRGTVLGTLGGQGVQLINKILMALLLWFGAKLVIEGELSVGQLVAFNMLSGQVNQPILRLAQLWQDFQQFRISLERLGDVLNTPGEQDRKNHKVALPPVQGGILLEGVNFRYKADGPVVLKDVSVEIKPGQIIGFVGRSGSGKSTITKLVQRLYVPEKGRVLVDGTDIALMDPAWLRRQIGVVLQENVLFNRSIRDNIALSDPSLPMEKVMEAAKLAGAHDFITELPHGYETVLEERGGGLSGGQRQRIAIARALVSDPSILIFDEATSALDYESERIIQDNMKDICKGRTVLVVAHRLSTVRQADRIVVLDAGQIIEEGTHAELLNLQGRYYDLHCHQVGER
ncbi:type I secretion system permease/ATPase [Kiloniella sp. b19]|uniref:type I secretion system permease/ATPase n=1 Tax=Kiloniella sp. GXU_MW_B19 TaxID=3141326 RepID=UPI0031D4F4A6